MGRVLAALEHITVAIASHSSFAIRGRRNSPPKTMQNRRADSPDLRRRRAGACQV